MMQIRRGDIRHGDIRARNYCCDRNIGCSGNKGLADHSSRGCGNEWEGSEHRNSRDHLGRLDPTFDHGLTCFLNMC